MMDTGAQLTDQGEYYELRAKVPEYEQEHVSALIRGNQLVLQGSRSDNERIDLAPGRMKNSSAYQTFQETFPLPWPVDGKRMTREFVGDVMIVRVPKNNQYAFHPQHEPLKPDKLRAERPHFPDNIPHTKMDPAEEQRQQAQRDKDPTAKPTPGSGTLS
jgi:HSP20 family molecular chaperone IbpA